jgi:hypothetical protein
MSLVAINNRDLSRGQSRTISPLDFELGKTSPKEAEGETQFLDGTQQAEPCWRGKQANTSGRGKAVSAWDLLHSRPYLAQHVLDVELQ